MRRGTTIIAGVIAGLVLAASGEEVKEEKKEVGQEEVVGQLRLELGFVGNLAKVDGLREGELRPAFALKKRADGSMWGTYELRLGLPERDQTVEEPWLNREQAEVLLMHLEAYVRNGFVADAGWVGAVREPKAVDGRRRVMCFVGPLTRGREHTGVLVGGMGRTARIQHDDCEWAAAMLRQSLNDAEWLELFLLAEKNREDTKLRPIGLRGWTFTQSLGVVDLEELKKVRVSFWFAQTPWPELGGEGNGAREGANFSLVIGAVGRDRSPALRREFLEALGQIGRHQREGEVMRWEKGEELLRAFPENKSVFYRAPGKKEIRVSQEVVGRAEGILGQQDQLRKWCEDKVAPALQALMREGDPGIFKLLG